MCWEPPPRHGESQAHMVQATHPSIGEGLDTMSQGERQPVAFWDPPSLCELVALWARPSLCQPVALWDPPKFRSMSSKQTVPW